MEAQNIMAQKWSAKPVTRKNRLIRKIRPYLVIAPAMVLTAGILYPFGTAVYYSLTNMRLGGYERQFVGLSNYITMLGEPRFWSGLKLTAMYSLSALIIQLSLGFAIALLLNEEFKGRNLIRSLIIMPLVIPPIVTALIFKTMMKPAGGVLNYLLSLVGLPQLAWLGSPSSALWSLVLIDSYIFTPFVIMILLAGLQGIPKSAIEAARIDGASWEFRMKNLIFPMLKPHLIIVLLFRIIDTFKIFDLIYATTQGGPADTTRTLHYLVYEYGFRWNLMGYGTAHAIFLLILILIIAKVLVTYWIRLTSTSLSGA